MDTHGLARFGRGRIEENPGDKRRTLTFSFFTEPEKTGAKSRQTSFAPTKKRDRPQLWCQPSTWSCELEAFLADCISWCRAFLDSPKSAPAV